MTSYGGTSRRFHSSSIAARLGGFRYTNPLPFTQESQGLGWSTVTVNGVFARLVVGPILGIEGFGLASSALKGCVMPSATHVTAPCVIAVMLPDKPTNTAAHTNAL